MNLKQLKSRVGQDHRLRPLPVFVDVEGVTLDGCDLFWRLEELLDEPTRVRLVCRETQHVVELQSDNVREYRSPDFLLLRCQLTAREGKVEIEPVIGTSVTESDEFAVLETQLPALLAEMRRDLAEQPLAREFVVLKKSWSYLARGHELAYYVDEHPGLRNQLHILSARSLIDEITYTNVERFVISEKLARYLTG